MMIITVPHDIEALISSSLLGTRLVVGNCHVFLRPEMKKNWSRSKKVEIVQE